MMFIISSHLFLISDTYINRIHFMALGDIEPCLANACQVVRRAKPCAATPLKAKDHFIEPVSSVLFAGEPSSGR